MKKCPYCAEEIQDAAIVCRHCGNDLPASASPPGASPPPPAQPAAAAVPTSKRAWPLLTAGAGLWVWSVVFFGTGHGTLAAFVDAILTTLGLARHRRAVDDRTGRRAGFVRAWVIPAFGGLLTLFTVLIAAVALDRTSSSNPCARLAKVKPSSSTVEMWRAASEAARDRPEATARAIASALVEKSEEVCEKELAGMEADLQFLTRHPETAWPKEGRPGSDFVTMGEISVTKNPVTGKIDGKDVALEIVSETVMIEGAGFKPGAKMTRVSVGGKPFVFVFDRADGKGPTVKYDEECNGDFPTREAPAEVSGNDVSYKLPQCWRTKLGL